MDNCSPHTVAAHSNTSVPSGPPPNGDSIDGHMIRLVYSVGNHIRGFALKGPDRELTLTARKEDLNYDIRVELQATDALGRVFYDAVNETMQGDIATFGSDYYEYMNHCLKAASDLVNKKAIWKSKVKPGEPEEHYKDVLDIMMQQIRRGDREAAALIPGMTSVYGVVAVNRALAGKVTQ